MKNISGFTFLVEGVQAFFAAQAAMTDPDHGWSAKVEGTIAKARWRQDNQGAGRANRVVFLYGGRLNSEGDVIIDAGELADPQKVGGNPRALKTWRKTSVISIWARAADGEAPSNDLAVIDAVEDLLEKTMQAVQFVAKADVQWGKVSLNAKPNEARFGAELLVEIKHAGALYDIALEKVTGVPRVDRGGIKQTLT